MKIYKRLFIVFCCTAILFSSLFMCYVTPVFAKPTLDEDGHLHVYNWDDIKECATDWVMYMASLAGAIFADRDFAKYVQNKDSWVNYWSEDNVTIGENGTSVTFSKELMAFIKQCIDEYAKEENTKEENGGFISVPTMDMSTIPPQWFLDSGNYKTFRNLMAENGLLMVTPKNDWGNIGAYFLFGDPFYNHSEKKKTDIVLVADKGSLERYRADPSLTLTANFYDGNRWRSNTVSRYTFRDSDVHQSWNEGPEYASTNTYSYNMSSCLLNATTDNVKERNTFLCSLTGERVRVFVSEIAAQNYSVGNRKVYFTENYYSYVPEDLSVSIDDLQKSVDDLQKIIDELLKQIGDDTSEKQIEELLKQILEELRKNPGTGGDGNGSGDINIDIDLSTTNSWLSKIYAKLSQIADDFKSFFIFEDAPGINAKYIASLLERMLAQLRNISSDVSDIKGQLETISEQEFNERSDSFLGEIMDALSEISEVVKTKFPFSIPNDLRIFLSKIAPAQPETEEQQIQSYSLDPSSGISLYSGEHGGGGSSDGEPNPPGGGGASRPGSGFVDVDHGGGGGSREPVEMREAPVFRLPIVIERYGIEEYIIIDMSPFDPLSRFSRGFFTIIFMVCLFNLTFKVIGMWGDLIG